MLWGPESVRPWVTEVEPGTLISVGQRNHGDFFREFDISFNVQVVIPSEFGFHLLASAQWSSSYPYLQYSIVCLWKVRSDCHSLFFTITMRVVLLCYSFRIMILNLLFASITHGFHFTSVHIYWWTLSRDSII